MDGIEFFRGFVVAPDVDVINSIVSPRNSRVVSMAQVGCNEEKFAFRPPVIRSTPGQ